MKPTIPLIILLFLFSIQLTAQEFPTRKGAALMSVGGNYSKDRKDDSMDSRFGLSAEYFIINKLFAGFDFSFYQAKSDGVDDRLRAIGPNVGYTFRKTGVMPYVAVGLQLCKSTIMRQAISTLNVNAKLEEQKFAAYGFTGGLILPVKKNFGIIGNINYTKSLSSDVADFEYIQATIGVVGLIF